MEVKYDKIGVDYNLTRKADPYLIERLFFHLKPKRKNTYLDIGCGTGNYTNEFNKKGYQFIGVDPSRKMISKAERINNNIEWRLGTAEELPLENESIGGIIGNLTIHHWSNLEVSFSNLSRILKYGGRIVIFTSTPEQMKGYWLNHYFPKMLQDSITQMPTFSKVKKAMENSGFEITETEKYFVKPDLEDHFLYCGKTRPELYLRGEIRLGISSFSDLANTQEIENGLTQLNIDIDSRKIKEIIKEYENDEGDYLYIIGRKASG